MEFTSEALNESVFTAIGFGLDHIVLFDLQHILHPVPPAVLAIKRGQVYFVRRLHQQRVVEHALVHVRKKLAANQVVLALQLLIIFFLLLSYGLIERGERLLGEGQEYFGWNFGQVEGLIVGVDLESGSAEKA